MIRRRNWIVYQTRPTVNGTVEQRSVIVRARTRGGAMFQGALQPGLWHSISARKVRPIRSVFPAKRDTT